MHKALLLLLILMVSSCKQDQKQVLTAQDIVDKAIAVSGGARYATSRVAFSFRGKQYISENLNGKKVLQRITF